MWRASRVPALAHRTLARTCRVRRKVCVPRRVRAATALTAAVQKCDEERVEDDSCKTCRRLGIQCLGWGPKRPDWMRVRALRHDRGALS